MLGQRLCIDLYVGRYVTELNARYPSVDEPMAYVSVSGLRTWSGARDLAERRSLERAAVSCEAGHFESPVVHDTTGAPGDAGVVEPLIAELAEGREPAPAAGRSR